MKRTMHFWLLGFVVAALALSAAATDAHAARRLVGADGARGAPRNPLATYTVGQCTATDTGAVSAPQAGLAVYLEAGRRGAVYLREINLRNQGLIFVNHWTAADGDHFFGYYRRGPGFEYIIPPDRTKPGTRLVYYRGMFRAERAPGRIIKVTGSPSQRCDLLPPGSVMPPPPAAPAPGQGCSKDTDCKGTRICQSGVCVEAGAGAAQSLVGTEVGGDAPIGDCDQDVDCEGYDVCQNNKCIPSQ